MVATCYAVSLWTASCMDDTSICLLHCNDCINPSFYSVLMCYAPLSLNFCSQQWCTAIGIWSPLCIHTRWEVLDLCTCLQVVARVHPPLVWVSCPSHPFRSGIQSRSTSKGESSPLACTTHAPLDINMSSCVTYTHTHTHTQWCKLGNALCHVLQNEGASVVDIHHFEKILPKLVRSLNNMGRPWRACVCPLLRDRQTCCGYAWCMGKVSCAGPQSLLCPSLVSHVHCRCLTFEITGEHVAYAG